MIRKKYLEENILKGSQGQACRLLSLTFTLPKRCDEEKPHTIFVYRGNPKENIVGFSVTKTQAKR